MIEIQSIVAHGIIAGALLLETDEQGNETTRCVRSVSRHPYHLDRVLLWADDRTGQVLDAHISDWVRRVIER
ncbi:hypothetical protein AWB91_12440 [Mycobacterium paraense]|uniref:Uncharacterized protein n=1 Tax=Mycobacterium paraense TaxID=767916 RepID=A0ABX3VQT6_9MYCO|nr:hypothetical protein [Mycobacterium paraense]ORW32258.1 hypothetical protein AWB91_12440 [Mycobacterium paraense]ORW35242.1 hypothetical protein AWB88_27150 [Mycobacterium paraense]